MAKVDDDRRVRVNKPREERRLRCPTLQQIGKFVSCKNNNVVEMQRVHNPIVQKSHNLTSPLVTDTAKGLSEPLTINDSPTTFDIDAVDTNIELAVVEYVEDLYKFYRIKEAENQIPDYMSNGHCNIDENMRMKVVDLLIGLHHEFDLWPETLHLTVSILDRFLSRKVIARKNLFLASVSSMILASKFQQNRSSDVKHIRAALVSAYSRDKVDAMEEEILLVLEWNLAAVTPYAFIFKFVKAAAEANQLVGEMENFLTEKAYYFSNVALLHYRILVSYRPSLIAAAAVYTALHTLEPKEKPLWNGTMEDYSENQLMKCSQMLTSLHGMTASSKFDAVCRKYSNAERVDVALPRLA